MSQPAAMKPETAARIAGMFPAYDFTNPSRKRLSLYDSKGTYMESRGGFWLANGSRGMNGMPWGPAHFETVAACQQWLNEQHAAGGWHQTLVLVAPGEWEVMTDGMLRWWNEGSHGAAEAKSALPAVDFTEFLAVDTRTEGEFLRATEAAAQLLDGGPAHRLGGYLYRELRQGDLVGARHTWALLKKAQHGRAA